MEEPQAQRLRQHPAPRFEGPHHQYDLDAVAARLKQEPRAGEAGRRQETLYKHGPVTVALFVFDRLTRLPPHHTKGVVTLLLLQGHIQVTAAGQPHDLRPSNLLVLAPGVQHDVTAFEESHVLVTVNLDPPPANPPA